MGRAFLSIHDLTLFEFHALLENARALKSRPGRFKRRLEDRTLALIFRRAAELPRLAFELGMRRMGGKAVYLGSASGGGPDRHGTGVTIPVLERWVDGLVLHGFEHTVVKRLVDESACPVLNSGSDLVSPVQALAAVFTIQEDHRDLGSLSLAYMGAADGLCHSLILAAAKAGARLSVTVPPSQAPSGDILRQAADDGKETGFRLHRTLDPTEAASGADVLCISPPFHVSAELLAGADSNALVLTVGPEAAGGGALPAGFEDRAAAGLRQVENVLHIQNAIVLSLLEN
jgi:ornithine carbamoyltransferase